LDMPFLLALKAEALHRPIAPSKVSRQFGRRTHWSKDLKTVIGLPNCTGSVVYFLRL